MRWVLVALVLWAVYGLFLYGHARNVEGSCAFDPGPYRQHLEEVDRQHTREAELVIKNLIASSPAEGASRIGTKKDLCVVISTVDRPGARYLLQSAASVLDGLSREQRHRTDVLVVNTDMKNKSSEYEADLELLRRTPGTEVIQGSPHTPPSFDEEPDPFVRWIYKERDDYVFSIDQCRARNPKYILMLEDDVWGADHWYTRVLPHLEHLERTDAAGWAYVKLYMATQYDDYFYRLHVHDVAFFVTYAIAWALVAVSAYVLFLIIAHMHRRSPTEHGMSSYAELRNAVLRGWSTLACAFFVCNVVMAAMVAPACIPKPSFTFTKKPVGVWPTTSLCCAQAQLFKVGPMLDQTIQCVMDNEYRSVKEGVDILVSNCARQMGGTVYETIPHLFQHIGIQSSSSTKRKVQNHAAWIPHMSVYFEE
jgi:hypothetical protein